MKNACIALKKAIAVSDHKIFSGLKVVEDVGYFFDEIRILRITEESYVKSVFNAFKTEFNNLFVICDQNELVFTKNYALSALGEKSCVGDFGSYAVYDNENTTLFVFSLEALIAKDSNLKSFIKTYLDKKHGLAFERIVLRAIGANETHIQQLLTEAKRIANDKLSYRYNRKYDEAVIEIFYGNETPKMLIDHILRLFAEGLGDTMYALEDIPIEVQLINSLKLRKKKLSVAESFTGGGIAKRIVSVSGASEVYFEGLNTYNEQSKISRLGVGNFTLNSFGAVSEKTAYEMALGLLNTNKCDLAIASTGIAGPKTDRNMSPVGLCYLAVGTKERILVYRYKFDGTREEITEKAINYALFLAYKQLNSI